MPEIAVEYHCTLSTVSLNGTFLYFSLNLATVRQVSTDVLISNEEIAFPTSHIDEITVIGILI